MYIIISIIQCTLDLTCWFIDLQKKIVEKVNSQSNESVEPKKVNRVLYLITEIVYFYT
jgi:hypothetical protein